LEHLIDSRHLDTRCNAALALARVGNFHAVGKLRELNPEHDLGVLKNALPDFCLDELYSYFPILHGANQGRQADKPPAKDFAT
jgi:hypothetical protein